MEFILTEKNNGGMWLCHKTMIDAFQDSIVLKEYWGPVQMCVFYLEYEYIASHYKIILECERGFLTIKVIDKVNMIFSPWMIYPEARYYHFEDKDEDIYQLINLTYRAIKNKELKFIEQNKVSQLFKERQCN